MNILLICNARLPVFAYGGTERVVWDLANALSTFGHHVKLLAAKGTTCPFAEVLHIEPRRPLSSQVPDNTDIVHFHNRPDFDPDLDFLPYVFTQHGNEISLYATPLNTVFVSANHADRFGSDQYVHNGLDWANYGVPDFARPRKWVHFLGNAAWKVKNLSGAMQVARDAGEVLAVLGGYRLNFKRGFRFTMSPSVKFFGMVGGQDKLDLLNSSRGLIFPVVWDEPFGLAVIESLYFGCPVFASRRGSLPELVTPDIGFLSNDLEELAVALREQQFDAFVCHQHALERFNANRMASDYIDKYKKVISGASLSRTRPRQAPKIHQ